MCATDVNAHVQNHNRTICNGERRGLKETRRVGSSEGGGGGRGGGRSREGEGRAGGLSQQNLLEMPPLGRIA